MQENSSYRIESIPNTISHSIVSTNSFIDTKDYQSRQCIKCQGQPPYIKKIFLVESTLPHSFRNTSSHFYNHIHNKRLKNTNSDFISKNSVDSSLQIPKTFDYDNKRKYVSKQESLSNTYYYSELNNQVKSVDDLVTTKMEFNQVSQEEDYIAKYQHLKDDMRDLNHRLTSYMQLVKESTANIPISVNNNALDTTLTEKLENLYRKYEEEYESLQAKYSLLSEEKTRLQLLCDNQKATIKDLQGMLSMAESNSVLMKTNMASMDLQMRELQVQLTNARTSTQSADEIIQSSGSNYVDLLKQEIVDLREKYSKEVITCKQSELKCEQVEKKLSFTKQVNKQTIANLQSQANMYKTLADDLKDQIQNAGYMKTIDQNLAEKMEEFVAKDKEWKKSLDTYVEKQKAELSEDKEKQLLLQTENLQLQMELSNVKANSSDLHSRVVNLQSQKDELQKMLTDEREAMNKQLQSAENKLLEMYNLMSSKDVKMTESGDDIGLRAEVETYRQILNNEEKRLKKDIRDNVNNSSAIMESPSVTRKLSYQGQADNRKLSKSLSFNNEPVSSQLDVENSNDDQSNAHNPICSQSDAQNTQSDCYIYETSPFQNVLTYQPNEANTTEIEPANQNMSNINETNNVLTMRPVGPIIQQGLPDFTEVIKQERPKSAVASLRTLPSNTPHICTSPHNHRPSSTSYHDYRIATNCATGKIHILQVQKDGHFVRLINDEKEDIDVSNYSIQQNVGGHPAAVFRLPPGTIMCAGSTITIWAGCADSTVHLPPTDFYWREQSKWGTGPECTTILCRPSGQVIAWSTAAHRFSKDAYRRSMASELSSAYSREQLYPHEPEQLQDLKIENKPKSLFIKRKKITSSKIRCRSPYTSSPGDTHPHATADRHDTTGNDGHSVNRQERSSIGVVPDPPPGQPYAGSGNPIQRVMSSISDYRKPQLQKCLSGRLYSIPVIKTRTQCPNAFMKPHARFEAGLSQIKDQYVA